MQRAEAVIDGVARLDQARSEKKQEKDRQVDQPERVREFDAAERRESPPLPVKVARQKMRTMNEKHRAGDEERQHDLGSDEADDNSRAEIRGDEAERAPQPHAAVVERPGADPARSDGLDQRHDRRPVDGEQDARGKHLPEPARSPQQVEREERSPSERDDDVAPAAGKIGGEADQRRKDDAGEERGGEERRDLAGIEPPPIEPNRHEGEIEAEEEEDRGVEETEKPGEGEDGRRRLLWVADSC